jgi:hypothetical protein
MSRSAPVLDARFYELKRRDCVAAALPAASRFVTAHTRASAFARNSHPRSKLRSERNALEHDAQRSS